MAPFEDIFLPRVPTTQKLVAHLLQLVTVDTFTGNEFESKFTYFGDEKEKTQTIFAD